MPSVLNEHFRYLASGERTEAYRAALREVLQPGDTVADLGCGLGILGLLALEEGAGHCTGIDNSNAIELARQSFARSGMAERANFLRGATFDISLPEPVDLLLCDHIGFFGFDYGIIAMLADARKRLLRPGGRIMPHSMAIGIALVESEALRGRVARWSQPQVHPAYHWLGEHEANTKHAATFSAANMISEGQEIARIDFTKDADEVLSFEGTLTAQRDGVIDGICGFFNCGLSATVSITNSPFAPDAIARPQAFLPCRAPIAVREGESIKLVLRMRHDPCLIAWSIESAAGAPPQQMSTLHSSIIPNRDGNTRPC